MTQSDYGNIYVYLMVSIILLFGALLTFFRGFVLVLRVVIALLSSSGTRMYIEDSYLSVPPVYFSLTF